MEKLVKSFGWAMNGIYATWNEEVNFRIESIIAFVVIVAGIYLRITKLEWVIIIACISAVLSAEILNTAIEDLCNKIEPNTDSTIGKIKDMMGGMVLIISLTSVIIGASVFSNHF